MTGFREQENTGRNEIAATVFLLCGLGMLLALLLANPEEMTPEEMAQDQPGHAATNRDGEILASCMNGQRIAVGEGYVLTCRVRKVRI
jgi:hypothetical protein